jgi:ribonuclease HII
LISPNENLLLFSGYDTFDSLNPLFYESLVWENGYRIIAGVDEAGRGPLAGPVVAAAVIIPKRVILPGIKDSKKMTEKAREKAFSIIVNNALSVSVAVVSHKTIDQSNILISSLEAMKQALSRLDPAPEYVLVDGIHKIPMATPQRCIIKGDQLSQSISAASVVAKVYRDRIMRSYHVSFPAYGFNSNKGYGTARHLKALCQYGPCPFHRLTFRGVC